MLAGMHHPYPDRGRALRQIMRRHRNQLHATPLLRAVQPGGREAGDRLRAGFAGLPRLDDYVLSTR